MTNGETIDRLELLLYEATAGAAERNLCRTPTERIRRGTATGCGRGDYGEGR